MFENGLGFVLCFLPLAFALLVSFVLKGQSLSKRTSLIFGAQMAIMFCVCLFGILGINQQTMDSRRLCFENMIRLVSTSSVNQLPIETKYGDVFVEDEKTVVKIGFNRYSIREKSGGGFCLLDDNGVVVSEIDANGNISVF